jgi:hypothetical protein
LSCARLHNASDTSSHSPQSILLQIKEMVPSLAHDDSAGKHQHQYQGGSLLSPVVQNQFMEMLVEGHLIPKTQPASEDVLEVFLTARLRSLFASLKS